MRLRLPDVPDDPPTSRDMMITPMCPGCVPDDSQVFQGVPDVSWVCPRLPVPMIPHDVPVIPHDTMRYPVIPLILMSSMSYALFA